MFVHVIIERPMQIAIQFSHGIRDGSILQMDSQAECHTLKHRAWWKIQCPSIVEVKDDVAINLDNIFKFSTNDDSDGVW